jgi:hypothetical protein
MIAPKIFLTKIFKLHSRLKYKFIIEFLIILVLLERQEYNLLSCLIPKLAYLDWSLAIDWTGFGKCVIIGLIVSYRYKYSLIIKVLNKMSS